MVEPLIGGVLCMCSWALITHIDLRIISILFSLRWEQWFLRSQVNFPGSWTRGINTVKMVIHLKSNLQILCNMWGNSSNILPRNGKITLKSIWKHKWPYIAEAILNKKNTAGSLSTTDFKLHHRTMVFTQKDTHTSME